MFKSKRRPLAIPQSEHLRLVGALAQVWGNADFDAPSLDRASFVAGVGEHDRGYGALDASAVMEMPEDEWLAITRRGFALETDPAADLITRYHLRRLARNNPSEAVQAMYREFDDEIAAQLQRQGFAAKTFDRIDRITELCDSISFNFCFEQPVEGQVNIFPRNDRDDEFAVQFSIDGPEIRVTPWPFSVPRLDGFILGYHLPEYPARLDHTVLPYHVSALA